MVVATLSMINQTTQLYIGKRMDNHTVVYLSNGVLLSNRETKNILWSQKSENRYAIYMDL